MLPSLGLFKSIACPLHPNCPRNPCFYSHSSQRQREDRPTEQVKRQKTAQQEPAKQKKPDLPKSRPEPLIPSLIPQAPKPAPTPPAANDRYKTMAKLERKPISPAAAARPAAPISALEAKKRTAHTATFKAKPTGPPTIVPSLKASIPLKVRQLIATKFYEAFARIYEPILAENPTLATEHAKAQEEKILTSTTNLAGYKQSAANILTNLKKRPVSTGNADIGLHGDWVDAKEAEASKKAWMDRAKECIVSLETLREMQYPLPDLLESSSESISDMVGTIHECDRCKSDYLIKAVLDKEDMDSCIYHPARIRMMKIDGAKEKVYACCQDPLGSVGCARGPHVYKDNDMAVLHQKIPYVKTPPRIKGSEKKRMVALDCEMGYTTAGMELIRLTAVDEDMKVLIDELVLPTSMIIDLNTVYSGIKTLEGVKYDLDSLRKELFKYVDEETILVGHGLENDFNALRIIHTNVIDTVALFPHKAGLPFRNSLRILSSVHLKKFIQTGTDGHDSLEDASVCIELLELYIKKVLDKKIKQ